MAGSDSNIIRAAPTHTLIPCEDVKTQCRAKTCMLTLVDVFLGAQSVAHLELPEGLSLGALVLLQSAIRATRPHIADHLHNDKHSRCKDNQGNAWRGRMIVCMHLSS